MSGRRTHNFPDRAVLTAVLLFLFPVLLFTAPVNGQDRPGDILVRDLRIDGNSSFSDSDLLLVMKTRADQPFDDVVFDSDLEAIIELYAATGYLQASIEDRRIIPVQDKGITKYDLRVLIYEDEPTRIRALQVKGVEALSSSRVRSLVDLEEEDIFSIIQVEVIRREIIETYLRAGYVHAAVTATPSFSADNKLADLVFEVSEGPLVHVGKISISGHEEVRQRIISRELRIKPGDILDYTRIEEDRTRLYATRVFRDVRITLDNPESFVDTSTVADLTVTVREADLRWIGMSAGYGQARRLQGEVEWGHNNLFNNNQRLSLRLRGSAKSLEPVELERRAILNYTEPWFLGYRVKGIGELFHQKEERMTLIHDRLTLLREGAMVDSLSRYSKRTIVNETGIDLALARDLGRGMETKVSIGYKYVNIALKSRPTNTNRVGWALALDRRDNIFEPNRGFFHNLSAELAGGPFLGGSNDFYRIMLDLRRFIPIYRSHLLAMHARLGQITSYGNSAHVPPEEHFWAVGLNLFRGYRYIEAGTFNFVWNIEYRFPLVYGMRCVAFSDIGQIAATRHDFIKHTDLDVSFGLGLRYPTPLGPVRLDFGVPLLHGELGFSKTILQFGLGQAF